MTTLFCPSTYTGQFATLHYHDTRQWQVTLWILGKPVRYTPHSRISSAILEILQGGMIIANEKMKEIFEQDVIMAGDE